MVVDAFVYHKYSKARSGFTTSSCSWNYKGRAYDLKQSIAGR
jgi:hypothetical protein